MAVAPDWLWPLVPFTGFLAPLVLLAYFILRIYVLFYTQFLGHYQLGLAWFFTLVEAFQLVPTVLLYFNRVFVPRRPRRPELHLESGNEPAVDVLITCCGEDNDTILNVVRAACESDWPNDRLSIILLDDGQSKELEGEMKHVKAKYPWAHYSSREKPNVSDYKAGNLNHGLKLGATLSGTPAPYIAGLDVDMIVKPNWLRAMMPHLLADPKMAMTCPPQYFWNIPQNDHVRQDLDYFYAITELIHDGLGAADCVGSGYLVRRQAMEAIGGFPTYSISEDTGCSSMLVGHGWSVAYVDEKLQCGQMPDTLHGHVKQRTRWTIGNVQTAFNINFRLWGPYVPRCTLRQRLVGFVFGAASLVNATLAWLGFFGLVMVLLSGYPFLVYSEKWQLAWILRLVCIWTFLDWCHKASFALFVGYRNGMRYDQADTWLVPYYTISFVRGFILPKRFGGTKPGFVSSGSLDSAITERRPRPSSLYRRFRAIFVHQLVWVHFLFILGCVLGVVMNIVRCFDSGAHIRTAYSAPVLLATGSERWVFLLTRIGWPPVFWLAQAVSCWIPIEYFLFPPEEVNAEDALLLDEKTGVRYVREEYWSPKRTRLGRISDHFSTLIGVYALVCFAGSFYV